MGHTDPELTAHLPKVSPLPKTRSMMGSGPSRSPVPTFCPFPRAGRRVIHPPQQEGHLCSFISPQPRCPHLPQGTWSSCLPQTCRHQQISTGVKEPISSPGRQIWDKIRDFQA